VLSPDGKWLLVTKTEGGQRSLMVMSIEGEGQINIAQSTTSRGTADQLTGWWAADSQSILLYIPFENGKQSDFEVTGLDGKQERIIQIADPILGKGDYLSLIG
jgi:Tol biopolymer transport system component